MTWTSDRPPVTAQGAPNAPRLGAGGRWTEAGWVSVRASITSRGTPSARSEVGLQWTTQRAQRSSLAASGGQRLCSPLQILTDFGRLPFRSTHHFSAPPPPASRTRLHRSTGPRCRPLSIFKRTTSWHPKEANLIPLLHFSQSSSSLSPLFSIHHDGQRRRIPSEPRQSTFEPPFPLFNDADDTSAFLFLSRSNESVASATLLLHLSAVVVIPG